LSSVFIAPITDAVRSRERRESSTTITRNSDPIVHEKIIGALTASGIWVRSAEGPIQVDALNVLIGNGDAKLHLSKLARAIYESRSDLQRFFPDPCGRNSVRFLLWFLTYGANEYRLADVLVSPLRSQWDAVLQSLESPLQRLWYRMVLQAMAASLTYREKARRSLARFKLLRSDVTLRMPGAKTPGGNGGHTAPQSPVGPGSGLFGANIVGYVRSEMGVGESVRCAIRAARATSIPVAIRTVDARGPYRLEDHSVARIDKDFPYAVNLFHVNADQIDLVMARLGPEFTRGKYNIGYWAWESAVFPDRWQPAFQYLQEIWTPSAFCQSAIAQKSPLPVLRMPHAIELECDHSGNIRSDFSIPYGGFVFLAMVDLLSVAERKNPLGVLKTFRLAQSGLRDCHLVLKINHGDECPEQMTAIVAAAQGLPVTIIDRTIDRQEVNALLRACDCMVSLHRAEGFGLSIAEAMYLEKPVIVTGYSGNTDFTRPDNSFLVDYDLTRVPSGCPPYVEGTFWAEPNLDHAAKQMQLVREDQALRASRAKRAGQFVRAELSPAAVGRRMRDRLELILADQLDAESTSRLRD
jgi:glycosyltransferase involved in cell wall biosynthesis